MNPTRIITNGESFKVQELRKTGFLWWKKEKWGTWSELQGNKEYSYWSKESAQAAIDRAKRIHNWKVVDEN